MDNRELAAQVIDRRTRSQDWLEDNYYAEWETVFKAYKCVREPDKDPDGKPDEEGTSVGLPMTYAHIRRNVARSTAQIPNLKFRAKDPALGDLISHTLMSQWDRGGVQRHQKRHMTQALLFGISIRPWYWAVEDFQRSKRIDPLNAQIDPATLQQIASQYGVPVELLGDPQHGMEIRARLMGKYGKGGLLPIKYPYTAYAGPKCDFLFIGDCYFQPNFTSLQNSQWFIVERRRTKEWLMRLVKRFPEQFKAGVQELLDKYPKGEPKPLNTKDVQNLRERMLAVIGLSDTNNVYTGSDDAPEWTVTEMHCPGPDASLTYVGGNDGVFLGKIEYPYDLDGRIAFTELVLIDDLLCGIGDSTARIIQGLQQLHDRSSNARMGLVYNLLRPLIGTTNQELIENPHMVKRYAGMRLVKMRGPGDMWVQGEQAAMASAAAGLQDESSIMRQYQLASGDSNMSMNAQVDPQQARTATGARLLAYNQDVLTKDLVDMFNETSVKPDAEMMFLLNRSELADAVEFDRSRYDRNYRSGTDMLRASWVAAEPLDFQQDGEITAEVGSTLADDDESKVTKAMNLWNMALQRPDLINPAKARDEVLVAMGKGRELQEWQTPPAPPPEPEIKANLSVTAKWELLAESERQQILDKAGIEPDSAQPGSQGAPAGEAPPGPPPPAEQLPGASAYAAAKGHSPFLGMRA
jgi:hypothetical protein